MTIVNSNDSLRLDQGLETKGRHGYQLPKASLSTRETQICSLLVKGLFLKDVALRLKISIHTADCHVRNMYQKLGVHDRGELVRHFAEPNVTTVRDTLTDCGRPK